MFNSFVEASLHPQGIAQVVVGYWKVRFDRYRFRQLVDGFIHSTNLIKCIGQAIICINIFRIYANRLPVLLNGFIEPSLLKINIA